MSTCIRSHLSLLQQTQVRTLEKSKKRSNRPLPIGIIGIILTTLCRFILVPVVFSEALGPTALVGYLDCAPFPLLGVFLLPAVVGWYGRSRLRANLFLFCRQPLLRPPEANIIKPEVSTNLKCPRRFAYKHREAAFHRLGSTRHHLTYFTLEVALLTINPYLFDRGPYEPLNPSACRERSWQEFACILND